MYKILVLLALVLGVLPVDSLAWYCYTSTGVNTQTGQCGTMPSLRDGYCRIGCTQVSNGVLLVYVRKTTGNYWDKASCENWQNFCAEGDIKDPCDIWPDDPKCQTGCTADDTTYINALKLRCDSLGGTNDLSLVNNGAQGCGLSGFCNLCNGKAYQAIRKQQQRDCCQKGHAPDTTQLKCTVESITSTDKRFIIAGQNTCLSGDPQIIITPDGVSYREGCDDVPPSINSSESQGSSDSQGSSESQGSSSGDSDINTISGQLEDIKDSLHMIILYDSTTASNSIDLVNYLYDIKICLDAGTCGGGAPIDYTGDIQAVRDTLHNSNNLLMQIADKDLSVQVTAGLTVEQQADLIANIGHVADSAAKYGIANGARLDSLRMGLSSTFADWSDTSGAVAGGDTTGKGAALDALGDTLTNALWGYPCDTTGGKTCNTAYIGANGLTNARTGWQDAADALGDTLTGGAVQDSLKSWANKIMYNGVLSGNGSATCPAVFNRTWQVPLGMGVTYTFGPFGKVICYDFFGGITFWALARIVLRAMVAITCMWWLYHAVTGTTARGDDD